MKNKNDILDELEKEAPFLSKIKKENRFSTPKNYFEVLPEVIHDKKLNNKSLKISFDRLSYRISIPISSLVIIFIVLFNWNTNTIESELTNEQLSELIVNEDYVEFDDYLVYDAYAEILEEKSKRSEDSALDAETNSDTEEYIEYLIENNIDINSIIEEL